MGDMRGPFDDFVKLSGSTTGKMTNKAWNKMVKDTGIVDGKKFTTIDTDILWSKMCPKGQKEIDFKTFSDGIAAHLGPEYAKKLKLGSPEEGVAAVTGKIAAGKSNLTGVTKISKTGNVDGFTDTTKYTGAHKARFDADGKGKGLDGR